MPANTDGMVREGITAYRAGRKDEARALLLRAVEIDQFNEQAWLWLSAVVESVDEQKTCLENVLTINPGNERAKQGLHMLMEKNAPPPAKAAAQNEDLLASASFTNVSNANPFNADADDELPSSIGFGMTQPAAPAPPAAPVTATSSISANYHVEEPSEQEYDAWVSNLGLGSAPPKDLDPKTAAQLNAAAKFMSTPSFDDESEVADPNTTIDFTAPPSNPNVAASLFGDTSGPFGSEDESFLQDIEPTPPPKPRFSMSPTQSPLAKKSSPPEPMQSDPLLDIAGDEELDAGALIEDFGEDGQLDKVNADDFFRYIPKEIKATRLPGTNERYPALILVGLLLSILLNVGAAVLLFVKLTAS